MLCSILSKQGQHIHHQISVCLQSQHSCPQRRLNHFHVGPVLSPRAWGPPLVSAQLTPQHLTQQRQQKLMAMKWLSCPRSELSPFQQHPMPGSPTSSLSSFPARQQPMSSLPCCLEVSDGVVKWEGGSEKLFWLRAALLYGLLETPDGNEGTEASEVPEEKEERWNQKVGERTQESCKEEKGEVTGEGSKGEIKME